MLMSKVDDCKYLGRYSMYARLSLPHGGCNSNVISAIYHRNHHFSFAKL
jgi:hypothetical protein